MHPNPKRWAEAGKYAWQALAIDSNFANYNLAGWILVAGNIDLDRGIALAAKESKSLGFFFAKIALPFFEQFFCQ